MARNTILSTAAHLALIGLLAAFSFSSCRRQPPRELTFFPGFAVAPGALPAPSPSTPKPPAPKPPDVAGAISEPIKQKPKPPKPAPAKTNVVAVSTNVVKLSSTPKPPKPKLTAIQIRAMLGKDTGPLKPVTGPGGAGGGTAGGPAGGGGGEAIPYGWYYASVYNALYDAWRQPAMPELRGRVTVAQIRVQRDGRITSKKIITPSGNPVMDASVRDALDGVQQLDPLPLGLGGASLHIAINFQLSEGE